MNTSFWLKAVQHTVQFTGHSKIPSLYCRLWV